MGSLAHIREAEVVGICDLVPELVDRTVRTWHHRWKSINPYTDYKEMLASENLDILTVATSDHRHADITVDGANSGVKAVFCEKPMATSLEDADRMIEACEANRVVLQVDYTKRWTPLFHKVRETIRAGTIGPLGTIVANRGGSMSKLFHNATHTMDAFVFFAESDPVQVFARLEDGYEDWDRYRGEGGRLRDPAATGFVLFRNGVRALYNGSKGSMPVNSMEVSGPKGRIYFGINDRTAALQALDPASGAVGSETLVPEQYKVDSIEAAYAELIRLIENGGSSSSPGREARKAVQIMCGFLKSHQAGSRLVDVDP
jgi:predicted dehydrogenase